MLSFLKQDKMYTHQQTYTGILKHHMHKLKTASGLQQESDRQCSESYHASGNAESSVLQKEGS